MSAEISEEIRLSSLIGPIRYYAGVAWAWLAHEIALQKPRLFLWFPVILSLGILVYFALPAEPPIALGMIAVMVSLAVLIVSVKHRIVALIFFLVIAGFAGAQFRAHFVYTPILQKEIKAATVSGRIERIEDMEDGKGSRLLLSHVQIEKITPDKTPVLVRMSVRSDEGLHVGQRVRMLAGLGSPSPPLNPGGFDFQRYMYFQRIGALGFAFKQPQVIGEAAPERDVIERIRVVIDRRIAAVMPYPEAAIAMALTTGRRAAISQETNDAITAAGLAHILSISGLHIGLVSGLIFFVIRLLMVCVPGMALRHPVKKYAVVPAFAGAVFYSLLAGSTVPTERSLIMIGIALLAIVLGRSPLSIRLVASAALVVLLWAPESLMSASFQMSFSAVAALVLVFDWLRPQFSKWYSGAGWIRKAALYLLSVCLTTVIATIATAPFTVIHFQQLSLYGVIANGVAVPLSAFMIMPAGLTALLAMPFGLDYWPLRAMGAGITGMVDISVWVASLPHALVKLPGPQPAVLPCFAAAVFILFLVRGRLRYLAIVPALAAVLMIGTYRQPDIIVDPEFKLVGVKGDDGAFYVSSLRKEKFIREKWESLYGHQKDTALAWSREGTLGPVTCDELACRAVLPGGRASILKSTGALAEECRWADVVLSYDPVKGRACGNKPVIDKFSVKDYGAHAVWLKDSTVYIMNAEQERGRRLWTSLNADFSDRNASDLRAGPGF